MIRLPLITSWDLAQAKDWGDGWCLACGERQVSLPDARVVHVCATCDETAVVSAEDLEAIAAVVGD